MANSVDPDSEPSHQDLQCLQNKQQQQNNNNNILVCRAEMVNRKLVCNFLLNLVSSSNAFMMGLLQLI